MPRARWRSHEALRTFVYRFRVVCSAIPRAAWRRWLTTLALGYAGTVLLTFGLIRLAQAAVAAGVLAWEAAFLQRLEAELPLPFSTAVWLQTIGTDITLALVVVFSFGVFTWIHRPLHALSIVATLFLADLVVRIAWLAWDRPRPSVIMEGIAAPGFASFPSGHTAKSVAVYGLLALFWIRGSRHLGERCLAAILALALVSLVAVGRLRMGVHWPSDVVGGAIIGGAWLAVIGLALGRATRAMEG